MTLGEMDENKLGILEIKDGTGIADKTATSACVRSPKSLSGSQSKKSCRAVQIACRRLWSQLNTG
jgi:hypothetical protein